MTYHGNTVNMVDCGNIRCFQERRLIKKDLMSWSKKIPLVVGLETVAEYVGRRKVKKLFEPFHCLEPKEPQDWEPEENCFYCADRIHLLFDAIEKTDSKDGGKILKDHPSLRHLGDVLPFLPQFYTSDYGREILSDIKTAVNEPEAQAASDDPQKQNIELKVPSLAAGSKNIKDNATNINGKRSYTEMELGAPVTEIRNGKPSSRKTSMLHGSSRSALHNKIFSMEVDDCSNSSVLTEEESSGEEQPLPQKQSPLLLQTQERPLLLTDLLQLSTLQYLAPVALPYFIRPEMFMIPQIDESEWEKKLQTIRHKHNLCKASMNHYKVKALTQHKLKPFQYDLIRKLTQERLELERNLAKVKQQEKILDPHSLLSQTHASLLKSLDFSCSPPMKKLKQEVIPEHLLDTSAIMQSALYKALNLNTYSLTGSMRDSASPDVEGRILAPEIKAKRTKEVKLAAEREKFDKRAYDPLFKYENTRIGDTLKDIIVKTISEKVKCKLESADFSGLVGASSNAENQKAKDTIMSAFSVPETSSPPKRSKKESSTHEVSSLAHRENGGNSGSQTKKTRPKRGQYRKYNSQLLTEAVKAVQRGEMSVHRAGSYYGVPHSTLEYKVKERHLLRQKKIKEQQEAKLKQEADEAASRSKTPKNTSDPKTTETEDKNIEGKTTVAAKLKSSPAWLPPFNSQLPYESAAALGIFGGSGMSLSTPASELLRKLQHKVQSKSESGDESSTSDYTSSEGGYVYIN